MYALLGGYDVASTGQVRRFYTTVTEDSIKIKLQIVPLKVGTYCLGVTSNFFEGSEGKTRTQPYFKMPNHNFDKLWKIPGESYEKGDDVYDRGYLFAAYE